MGKQKLEAGSTKPEDQDCMVHICRVHKGSPFIVSHVIPSIKVDKPELLILRDEVQDAIRSTFGKSLVVQIYAEKSENYLEYRVFKNKSKINQNVQPILCNHDDFDLVYISHQENVFSEYEGKEATNG